MKFPLSPKPRAPEYEESFPGAFRHPIGPWTSERAFLHLFPGPTQVAPSPRSWDHLPPPSDPEPASPLPATVPPAPAPQREPVAATWAWRGGLPSPPPAQNAALREAWWFAPPINPWAEQTALVEPTEKILCLKITTLSCGDPWLSVNYPVEAGPATTCPARPQARSTWGRGRGQRASEHGPPAAARAPAAQGSFPGHLL